MAFLRRLTLGLFALAATSLALAVPGALADQLPGHSLVKLTSTHFQITFDGDFTQGDFLSSAQANDVLGFAERAYVKYTSMGYAPPVDDGDGNGLIEIHVESLIGEPFSHFDGFVEPLSPLAATTAGIIHMDVVRGIADPTDPSKIDAHAVAHELFTLFEWRIFHDTNLNDQWLEEGTAEWAAFHVDNTVPPWANSLGETDRALDCIGTECGYAQPSIGGYNEFYDRMAKSGWSFFQYLSEKYGDDIVKQILAQRAADGNAALGTQPVDEVLATKSSSLSAAFNGWITARLNGGFSMAGIAGILPTPFATMPTGLVSPTLTKVVTVKVAAVGHLSARYIQLTPGDGSPSGTTCVAATLGLNVTIPAGVTAAPAIFINSPGNTPQALAVSGSAATTTIPWSTCSSTPPLFLSLPNATVDPKINGNEFVVTATLNFDPKALAPAAPPPPGVTMPGLVITVPTADTAPSIDVYGPELIRLSADARVLRLIVASDGPGRLQAALGSLALGTASLRAGHNDVRFTLPSSALLSLRRTLAAGGWLTLTPLSPQGSLGKAVIRQVAVDPSVKPVAKPKSKPKTKPKSKSKQKAGAR